MLIFQLALCFGFVFWLWVFVSFLLNCLIPFLGSFVWLFSCYLIYLALFLFLLCVCMFPCFCFCLFDLTFLPFAWGFVSLLLFFLILQLLGQATCRVLVPQPEVGPEALEWEHRVQDAGPLENSCLQGRLITESSHRGVYLNPRPGSPHCQQLPALDVSNQTTNKTGKQTTHQHTDYLK